MILNFKPTKDAKTLGGHEAEYFAKTSDVTLPKYWEKPQALIHLGAVLNLDTLDGKLTQSCVYTCLDKSGSAFIVGYYNNYGGGYGTQIKMHYFSNTISTRAMKDGVWSDWDYDVTHSDLTAELAKYLPLTGGYITGAEAGIGAYNSEIGHTWGLRNAKRYIMEQVLSDGTYRLRDSTNDIITSPADGINTFNGIASGNLALTGTTGQQVKAPYGSPLSLNNTTESGTSVTLRYYLRGEHLGALGFNGVNSPMFLTKDGVHRSLHHDGNSVKVVINKTAPSDNSALWVY